MVEIVAIEGHHRIQLRTGIFATNRLYQEVFCSSVSKLTRIDYKPSNKHY